MAKAEFHPFILVVDDFYQNPQLVFDFAKGQEYFEHPEATGYRSANYYHEPGIQAKLEKLLGIKIDMQCMADDEWNGIFYYTLSGGRYKEKPAIHTDPLLNDISVLVYLTPEISAECGTTFWKHRRTGIYHEATSQQAKKLGMPLKDLREELETDSLNRNKWIKLDQIAYKYNRMLAFPSALFHSASKHFGKGNNDGRIIQVFRLVVDWNTYKAGIKQTIK